MGNFQTYQDPNTTIPVLSKHGGIPLDDPQSYRNIVGALQYATPTILNITYSVNKFWSSHSLSHRYPLDVNKLRQFMHFSTDTHWQVVKQLLKYPNDSN